VERGITALKYPSASIASHNLNYPFYDICYTQSDHFSNKEKTDPYEVLEAFFGDTNLDEIETLFDKIFETCLTADNGPFSKGEQRGNLLCMRRKIEQVLGACYRIAGEKENNPMTGKIIAVC